jgi:hypothetical protein
MTNTHLKKHSLTLKKYINDFNAKDCISTPFKKGHIPWNKDKIGLQKAWNKNICRVNHNFFSKNSIDMFYILGLFFADGYISMNRKSKMIGLSLHKKDVKLVKKIRKILQLDKKLYIDRNQIGFQIFSEEMYNTLTKWGCIRNKSLTMLFPSIPSKYLFHFIRGYLDGDGSVFINNRNQLYSNFTSGSLIFLQKLNKIIKDNLNIEGKIYYKKGNCYFLVFSTSKTKVLLKSIYKDKSLFMKRKYIIYKNYMEKVNVL